MLAGGAWRRFMTPATAVLLGLGSAAGSAATKQAR
jgi:hypothetical protein